MGSTTKETIVDVFATPAGADPEESIALLRTDQIEVIRRVVPAGTSVPVHTLHGDLTMLCLAGEIQLTVESTQKRLAQGVLALVEKGHAYSYASAAGGTVLMTIVRTGNAD
jgi:quercetin dioxygenase-like cupin family protein